MGLFDRSAFPDHLDEKHEVEAAFPDDNETGLLGKIRRATKHWNAFGPRSPSGIAFGLLPVPLLLIYAAVLAAFAIFGYGLSVWHFAPFLPIPLFRKWRAVPVRLWANGGAGRWRFEADGEPDLPDKELGHFPDSSPYYLSRNQLWKRWHVALQWPLFFSAHWYKSAADVIPPGQRADRDGKIWIFYFGAKRDADAIFWLWAFFIGRNFK